MIPVDTPGDVGEVLRLLRQLHGMTQSDVDARSGVCFTRIPRYERGLSTPDTRTLLVLLAAVGHRLAIVPLAADGPESALSASVSDETASEVGGEGSGTPGGSMRHAEAFALLRQAHHLRTHGERAPGGSETWADWDRQAETLLRAADRQAGVVLVDDGSWQWRWTPTATGSYSGPHGPDICPAIGCQHEDGAA